MTAMHNGAAGSYAGIVLAAGSGTRVGHSGSKAYLPLAGRSVLVWALETLAGTGDGERLVSIQTPQAFRAAPLLDAYEAAARDGFAGTDTAACIERYTDLEVAVVPGEPGNLKITFADDLLMAERLLRRQAPGGVSPARSRPGRARPGRGSR